MPKKLLTAVLAAGVVFCALSAATLPKIEITPETQSALDRISANSLRGNLSFLASDLLEGRATPSRGLDIAAEYIAAQFRRAGLEPAVNGDYFQTADMVAREPNLEGFRLQLANGPKTLDIDPADVTLEVPAALDLDRAPVYKVAGSTQAKPEELDGKAVLLEFRDAVAARKILKEAHPALFIIIGREVGPALPSVSLIDPGRPPKSATPRMIVRSKKVAEFYESLESASTSATVTVHVAPPKDEHVKLRNVVGLLRGSDPALRDTYVVLSAHYDHLGMKPDGDGDRIYNGANDDGSGTVSVIEIASALASMKTHPRRSIVFMAFFGEEEGMIGSQYYVNHPVFPVSKTVADVELEQLGRTDATGGPQRATAAPTGYEFSDIPEVFKAAGELLGVKVYDSGPTSERYYQQSDNLPFAEAGVPSHTFCVAYEFPDYHAVGDEWQKIDYDNMAKVDRMLALGLLHLADDINAPHWNTSNLKTKRYADAAKQ